MNAYQTLDAMVQHEIGLLRTSDAASAHISRTTFAQYVRLRGMERVGNGIYLSPDAWKDGSISGICAKGNFEVDVIWENHQLKKAVVCSNAGGDCVIKYADQTISFKTVKGRSYQIGYDAAKGFIKK